MVVLWHYSQTGDGVHVVTGASPAIPTVSLGPVTTQISHLLPNFSGVALNDIEYFVEPEMD